MNAATLQRTRALTGGTGAECVASGVRFGCGEQPGEQPSRVCGLCIAPGRSDLVAARGGSPGSAGAYDRSPCAHPDLGWPGTAVRRTLSQPSLVRTSRVGCTLGAHTTVTCRDRKGAKHEWEADRSSDLQRGGRVRMAGRRREGRDGVRRRPAAAPRTAGRFVRKSGPPVASSTGRSRAAIGTTDPSNRGGALMRAATCARLGSVPPPTDCVACPAFRRTAQVHPMASRHEQTAAVP